MTTINGKIVTMTFNRFGVKKSVQFHAENSKEVSFFSKIWSGKVVKMTKQEYLEM